MSTSIKFLILVSVFMFGVSVGVSIVTPKPREIDYRVHKNLKDADAIYTEPSDNTLSMAFSNQA